MDTDELAEGGSVQPLIDERYDKPRRHDPQDGVVLPQPRQRPLLGLRSGRDAAVSARHTDEPENNGHGGTRAEQHACHGKTEPVRENPAEEHPRQTADPVQAVIQPHEIAAIIVGRYIQDAIEATKPQQCPCDTPQAAQKKPDGKAVRKGVTEGGDGGEYRGDENAGPITDMAVQPAYHRIEREPHQPVDRQDNPHFP